MSDALPSTGPPGPPPGPPPPPPGVDLNNLPNRQDEIIGTMVFFIVLTLVFVLWRIWVNVWVKRRVDFADGLIVIAAGLNTSANIFAIFGTFHGSGYYVYDPAFTSDDLTHVLRYLWYGQLTNVWAMFFLKASISAYLLKLNFSPKYRAIIWISTGIILVCNFIIPNISLLGACAPISYRWNKVQPGRCWTPRFDSVSGYLQSSANIVTDIIYSSAPLVYLSSVQLPKSTQWGLRVVFLFGLVGTGISIAKLTELHILSRSADPTWDGVALAILSVSEVGVGIFAACLPPLRKYFHVFLRRAFPTNFTGSRSKKSQNHANPMSYELSKHTKSNGDGSAIASQPIHDDDSEISILHDAPGQLDKKSSTLGRDGMILKTVNVAVQQGEAPGQHDAALRAQTYNQFDERSGGDGFVLPNTGRDSPSRFGDRSRNTQDMV